MNRSQDSSHFFREILFSLLWRVFFLCNVFLFILHIIRPRVQFYLQDKDLRLLVVLYSDARDRKLSLIFCCRYLITQYRDFDFPTSAVIRASCRRNVSVDENYPRSIREIFHCESGQSTLRRSWDRFRNSVFALRAISSLADFWLSDCAAQTIS